MADSVIACHELMHYLNRKKGKLHLMAVKTDLANTYDRVEWCLLDAILHLLGFLPKFVRLIMVCISSASFSLLINGSPFDMFRSSRGLR